MGIYEKGYEAPSPIQEEAVPVALAGRDVLARAKNGTGKTASFLIPALHKVQPEKNCIQCRCIGFRCLMPLALILVPTRELALQTSAVCKELGKYISGLEVMVTTGGTSLRDDIIRLEQNISIVIATPGRILDLAEKNIAKLENCDYVVMDEVSILSVLANFLRLTSFCLLNFKS
jgi:ATP-dependent RNA helicase DDX6/DHH1